MKLKKVVSAGFTVECVSWENDGDNYCTKSVTYATKEEAFKARDMVSLCRSHNSQNGLGNMCYDDQFEDNQIDAIKEVYKKHNVEIPSDDDYLEDELSEYTWELMGSSEFYQYRVCESVVVYSSDEDVYCPIILE